MTEHHLGEELAAMADDGRGLEPERRAELERHVAGCAECREAIRSAKLVLRTIDEQVPAAPAQAFDARLFQRLDEIDRAERAVAAEPRASPWFERIGAWFTLPRFAAVGAAAAAVALAIVLTAPRGTDPDPDAPRPEDLAMSSLVESVELLAVAEDLELFQDLETVEDLDVLEDLEAIEAIDEAG